jgi:hypothetical protein
MRSASWVLGYHGCDRAVGEAILAGHLKMTASENLWDWLGTGIYFWEDNPRRALDWAIFANANPNISQAHIKEPFVIGAIINLGNCLDLMQANSIQIVKRTHRKLLGVFETSGLRPPANTGSTPDRSLRMLDCAVVNHVHHLQETEADPPFDSVRAVFTEGQALYEGAGFQSETHIQICVRNERSIAGFFRPRDLLVPGV